MMGVLLSQEMKGKGNADIMSLFFLVVFFLVVYKERIHVPYYSYLFILLLRAYLHMLRCQGGRI